MQGSGIGAAIVGIIRFALVVVVGFAVVLLFVASVSPEARAAFGNGVFEGVGGTIKQLPGLIQDIRDAV